MQGMVFHPGWHAVVPCGGDVHRVYQVLEGDRPDLNVKFSSSHVGSIGSLKAIMALPNELQKPLLVEAHMRLVNAHHFGPKRGDLCHDAVLTSLGEPYFQAALASSLGSMIVHQLALCLPRWSNST